MISIKRNYSANVHNQGLGLIINQILEDFILIIMIGMLY